MFEIWSYVDEFEINGLFFVSLATLALTVFLSIIIAVKMWSKKNKKLTATDTIIILGSMLSLAAALILFAISQIDPINERFYGRPTGEVYSNPFDVPADKLNDDIYVKTDTEDFEKALTDALEVDKISINNGDYETFLDNKFGEFTGVTTGDENDPLDDTSVSGVFYFTETDLVIITNYDTEHQETIRIATD